MTNDPKTGIALPDKGEIEAAIPTDWSSIENPFVVDDKNNMIDKSLFQRLDTKPDAIFYQEPRFVEHIDANAVKELTRYISTQCQNNNNNKDVLDLCSSWTSHLDIPDTTKATITTNRRIAGLGMNAQELQANPSLTEWVVQDLNVNPTLGEYKDNSFDVVLIQLSIDYLTKPLEVLKEAGRVLRKDGTIHILFSNRLFLTKAVGLWTGADDIDHVYYVACYLHFCQGGFLNNSIVAQDLSTRNSKGRIVGDPLYVVRATRA